MIVLSDLDRTLFDTERFFKDVWELIASLYDCCAEQERSRSSQFYTFYGNSYDYEFFVHAEDAIGDAYDELKLRNIIIKELSGRYLYEDVTDAIIPMFDGILTFGNDKYQQLKLSLCPKLSEIPKYITLQPKGEFIVEHFTAPCVLIDDKPLYEEIKPPSVFIRILRDRQSSIISGTDITSFKELGSVLASVQVD